LRPEDDDVSAVLFLDRHPGMSWADLMATPDRIVTMMRMLDFEKARHQ
jgi:hypothetical protein